MKNHGVGAISATMQAVSIAPPPTPQIPPTQVIKAGGNQAVPAQAVKAVPAPIA